MTDAQRPHCLGYMINSHVSYVPRKHRPRNQKLGGYTILRMWVVQ